MERSAGILLPVASLPSPHGIGTMGAAAREFVDFLAASGQSWWQVLPVGPTSYGDSPYQSPSAFAGNPYLIDLDQLVDDGLLTQDEVDAPAWGDDPASVDYELLYRNRMPLLRLAYQRGWERDAQAVAAFVSANEEWLPDYALFMAVKAHFGMTAWTEWPDEGIRLHHEDAVARWREELADDIRLYTYVQFLFFRQWEALRAYAHDHSIGIIGDLPIYVALDSSDVWASPEMFQLDEKNVPVEVAGVPPDAFTEDGQLWGNPLYDYDAMAADGYGWWIRRIGGVAKLFDVIRIDHFRGFESYWAVPYGATTAKDGRWVKGPGMSLVSVLKDWYPYLRFIAEDLGYATPEVAQLLADSGFPGMRVLEFAFDSRDESGSSYLPHNYPRNCVCYIGTHDNEPLAAWAREADEDDLALATRYLGLNEEEGLAWGFVRAGMGSVADLFVAQMQDYLELGPEARTNTPGTLGGNWRWRMTGDQASPELADRIATMTHMYGRSAGHTWQK